MKTVKWAGLLLVAAGLCVLGYQAIEGMMSEGTAFYNYTLVDMFGERVFAWYMDIPVNSLAQGIEYVITMAAYALFLIVGAVLLIIHGIFARS